MSWHKSEYQNSVLRFYFRQLQAVCLCCFPWVAQVCSSNANFSGFSVLLTALVSVIYFFVWNLLYLAFIFKRKRGEGFKHPQMIPVYTMVSSLYFTWVTQHYVVWPHHGAEFYTIAWRTKGKQKNGQDVIAHFFAAGLRGLFNFALERARTVCFLLPRILQVNSSYFSHTHTHLYNEIK